MSLTFYLGALAAICTTISFVPQVLKLWKQGGKDLSYPMLFLFFTGTMLWLAYGLRIHSQAVIWANVVTGVLVVLCVVLKASPRRTRAKSVSPRLSIAVDMDEVIADSFSEFLRRYNQRTAAGLTAEKVARHGLRASVPEQHRALLASIPEEEGFFRDLAVVPGSREAVAWLSQHHDVFIASAAMEVPGSFADKFKWLEKNFPFIPPAHIVFCGDKGILDADVLIDDRSRHFRHFAGRGILFTAPHNAQEAAPLRANNWDEVLRILSGEPATGKPVGSRTLSMNPAES
jgi:5'(3')-deoxyribonucleotidase/uncharacterized protein with PQ loop repeat